MEKLKDFVKGFIFVISLLFLQLLFLTKFAENANYNKLTDILAVIVFSIIPLGLLGLTIFFIIKKRRFISLGIIAGLIIVFGLIGMSDCAAGKLLKPAETSVGNVK